mgnify:CR=1 FL=1
MEFYKHFNLLKKYFLLLSIFLGVFTIKTLLDKDIFFLNHNKNIEFKNNEFESKNLTSIKVIKQINKIKNKLKYFSNIISDKKVIFNESESNLTKIIDFFEKLNSQNLTEQNINPFNFNKNPKISIIIPIYNSQNFIFQILKSIQIQSLKDIEIIFVDDCSLDNTTQIIENLQKIDKRIILLKNKQNKGPFYSRNKAVFFAKGEYIQFMDSDDILINNILEISYIIAKINNIDIIQYKFVKNKNKKYYIFDEITSLNIINQPELSDQMFYGKGKLKQDNYYIFNKIINRKTFLNALIFIGDDLLKTKLYMNEDLLQLFSVLRVANSLLFINYIGYLKLEGMNYTSLFSSHQNPKSANSIFHDNIIEIRFLFNKSHNNNKDKSIILDFIKMSNRNYKAITKYITIGFDYFEETLNLLLNSSYYDENQKSKIKKYKNNLMMNKNYPLKK